MRRRLWAGLGLGIVAGGLPAWAQAPATPSATPAARISLIQPLQSTDNTVLSRGQATDKPPMSTAPMGTSPMGGSQLPPPKSFPTPNVTESRSGAAIIGQPIPMGQPIPVGQPYMVGQPIPVGPPVAVAPSVFPGGDPILPPAPELEAPLYTGGATSIGPFGLLTAPQRLFLNAELLGWWVRPDYVPVPLVTAGPPGTTGALNQPGTAVLFGNDYLQNAAHLGARFSGVWWLGQNQDWGVDGSFFFLGRNGYGNDFYSGANGVLARPFNNLSQGGIPFSQLVAAPGLATGSISILNETSMWGADINLRKHLYSAPCWRVDGFLGFRYLRFAESLEIIESFSRTANSDLSIGNPTALFGTVRDKFRTVNNFYAPQIGLTAETRRGRWFLEGRASIAMGTVFQTVITEGSQDLQLTTGPSRALGGLLVVPGANQGTFGQTRFGVMPEAGLKVGFHLTQNLRFAVGYNFLYLNSVVRPAGQIDTNLDATKIPNFPLPGPLASVPGRPRVPLTTSDVYAQGISFSLQWFW